MTKHKRKLNKLKNDTMNTKNPATPTCHFNVTAQEPDDPGALPPLTQLQQCPLEDRQWAFDLRENLNQSQARAAIQERLGIPLGSDTAYSRFCEWHEREKTWDHLDAMAEQDLPRVSQSFPSPAREQLRDAALLRAYAIADQSGDIDLSLCVMNAELKVRQDRRAWEKFNQERQTRLEAAFKEFFATIQLYPDLSDEFFAWRDRFAARYAAEHHTTLKGEPLPPNTPNAPAPPAPPTPTGQHVRSSTASTNSTRLPRRSLGRRRAQPVARRPATTGPCNLCAPERASG